MTGRSLPSFEDVKSITNPARLLQGIEMRALGYESVEHAAGARAATHVILRKRG